MMVMIMTMTVVIMVMIKQHIDSLTVVLRDPNSSSWYCDVVCRQRRLFSTIFRAVRSYAVEFCIKKQRDREVPRL
jgi:hypothetical protein